MEQLRMSRDNSPAPAFKFPEGFTVAPYREGDWESWCRCCIDGELGLTEISEEQFDKIMGSDDKVRLENIFFVLSPEGRAVGTVTYQHREDKSEANVHMVSVEREYRGMGISAPMVAHAVKKMIDEGVSKIYLSTDDWRIPAIKTYLKCGFAPIIDSDEMAGRWGKII